MKRQPRDDVSGRDADGNEYILTGTRAENEAELAAGAGLHIDRHGRSIEIVGLVPATPTHGENIMTKSNGTKSKRAKQTAIPGTEEAE